MQQFGEIDAFDSTLNHSWGIIESYKTIQNKCNSMDILKKPSNTTEQDITNKDIPVESADWPVASVISETDLTPSHTCIGYDSQGNMKTFSNIKAPQSSRGSHLYAMNVTRNTHMSTTYTITNVPNMIRPISCFCAPTVIIGTVGRTT